MIKETLQILIAMVLLVILFFMLIHFTKYRKTHAEMVADLYKKLGKRG